jgi:diguanylate cyclase (GGDEF)-like protein
VYLRQSHAPQLAAASVSRAPKGISPGARLLVFVLCAAAAAATLGAASTGAPRAGDWTTFFALSAAAAVAQLFGVRTTNNQSYHLAIGFVVAGALLLPPELLALLCVVQHAAEWFKERYPLTMQSFNVANYTLSGLAASAAGWIVLGSRELVVDSRTAAAGLCAVAAFVLVNHTLLAGILRVARGHSVRQSGLFAVESLSIDLVLALVGVGVAIWWTMSPWFVLVAVAPLVLIRRALSVPELRAQASLDPKTGLYNAGRLNTALEHELERAGRFERPLSVIVADLDLLREVNNTYGHLAGDAVLLGVADAFRRQLRPYDLPARFGGEEFAAVLPETNLDEAVQIADRIRAAVEHSEFRHHATGRPVHATLSLGVASAPEHARTADELMHQADLALYRAKALGRNCVCAAAPGTNGLVSVPGHVGLSERRAAEPSSQPVAVQQADSVVESWPTLLAAGVASVRAIARRRGGDETAKQSRTATRGERNAWALIIPLLAVSFSLLALNAGHLGDAAVSDPWGVAGFALAVVGLQLLSIDLYGRGGESASAVAILAGGFALGVPAGMALAVLAALVQWTRRGAKLNHGLFDVANFALAAAAAAYVYGAIGHEGHSVAVRFAGAVCAAITYRLLNSGLLALVMSLAEAIPFRAVWSERLRWASLHYLAYAPLAFAFALAYEKLGVVGLAAFSVPPVLATFSVRQYVQHTRASVEEVRRANDDLRRSNAELAQSNERVRKTHLATIAALSRSIEVNDRYTGGHTERVGMLAVAIARKFGYSGDELEAIEIGALLHDIGKIGIPEAILSKPGPLSEQEWERIREHPVISDYILSEIDLHPFVRQIVRSSHERLDGTGYPDGLSGDEVPLPARIVLVADAFDALTSDRAYRAGRDVDAAFVELNDHAGTQFCPRCVDALEQLRHEQPDLLEGGRRSATLEVVA